MGPLRRLAVFFYDFVVGDDPRIAVAIVVALGLTAVVAGAGISAWWVLPLSVVAVLGFSIHRATEPAQTERTLADLSKLGAER